MNKYNNSIEATGGAGERKFKVGDEVIYQDLIGIVEALSETVYGVPTVALVSKANRDLSCTAREVDCDLYDGDDFDETKGLSSAYYGTARIENLVNSVTDKNFRDGNH